MMIGNQLLPWAGTGPRICGQPSCPSDAFEGQCSCAKCTCNPGERMHQQIKDRESKTGIRT
eukprot:1245803-Amphidinium_carterae.1